MSRPDEPVAPDPFTETALRLLPIPAHGETLLGRPRSSRSTALEPPDRPPPPAETPADRTDRLAASRGPAEPVVDEALALVPPALRKRSNAMVVAVAAAAVVVVMLAGTSLVRDDEQRAGRPRRRQRVRAVGTLDSLGRRRPARRSPPSPCPPATRRRPSDAVPLGSTAVHTGDADAAWKAMGPGSQDHFGTEAAFEEQLAAMDDGVRRLVVVEPEDVLITPVVADDDGTVAVVTLVGTTTTAGETTRRAEAFPVRIVDGKVVLEPFVDAGSVEVAVPAARRGRRRPPWWTRARSS